MSNREMDGAGARVIWHGKEWELVGDGYADGVAKVTGYVDIAELVPLHPEPAVGTVVNAHGRLWIHCDPDVHGTEFPWHNGYSWTIWSDLAHAPDLSPVVAVDDVADWLDTSPDAPKFLKRFGWAQ